MKPKDLRESPAAKQIIEELYERKAKEAAKNLLIPAQQGGKIMGTKVSDIYRSKHMIEADLNGETVKVTITGHGTVTFEGRNGKEDETKIILHLKEFTRPFVAVKTNTNAITAIFGTEDMDEWIGKTISIKSQLVDSFGKVVPAIRVQLTDSAVAAAPADQDLPPEAE